LYVGSCCSVTVYFSCHVREAAAHVVDIVPSLAVPVMLPLTLFSHFSL
jgi:hypothetical protein